MTDKERIEELERELEENQNYVERLFQDHRKQLLLLRDNENKNAIDALQKVKNIMEKKLDEFDNSQMRMIMGLYAFNIENEIDNLIKEYKEEE